MARGGAGRGQGRRKGSPNKKTIAKGESSLLGNDTLPPLPENPVLPLDYMLRVLNDPTASKDRKDRMASIAAPFCHARAESKGTKKGEQKEAAQKAAGRFAPGKAPNVFPIKKQG